MIGALLIEHDARITPALARLREQLIDDGHETWRAALVVAELRAQLLAQAALALIGAMAAQGEG